MLQASVNEITLCGYHICLQARFPTSKRYARTHENTHALLNAGTLKLSLAHTYVCKHARTLTNTKLCTQDQLQVHTFRQESLKAKYLFPSPVYKHTNFYARSHCTVEFLHSRTLAGKHTYLDETKPFLTLARRLHERMVARTTLACTYSGTNELLYSRLQVCTHESRTFTHGRLHTRKLKRKRSCTHPRFKACRQARNHLVTNALFL
jgi:hypothetical protein